MFNYNTMYRLAEFFDQTQFNQPHGRLFQDRLSSNLLYYTANYLVILCICLLYVCWIRPWFLVGLLISQGSGYYVFSVRKTPLVVPENAPILQNRVITRRETILCYITITSLFFLMTGGFASVLAVLFACLLVLIHGSLREKNVNSGGTTFVDVWKAAGKEKNLEDDGAPQDIENPGDEDEDELKSKNDEFRQNFRAQMRAKYLRKKD